MYVYSIYIENLIAYQKNIPFIARRGWTRSFKRLPVISTWRRVGLVMYETSTLTCQGSEIGESTFAVPMPSTSAAGRWLAGRTLFPVGD